MNPPQEQATLTGGPATGTAPTIKIYVGGRWLVLEINSGVMMESLGSLHPELVYAAYQAALDKVFA